MRMRTALLTALALLAFAGNSLLCRLALQPPALIDPASFSSLRLIAGAVALALLLRLQPGSAPRRHADWAAAAMLFAYVVLFSLAYVSLGAATGALILFGAVQLTMFGAGLRGGERFGHQGWLGLVVSVGGLVYLLSPGLAAPPAAGAASMAGAGVAWGLYSLRGRGVESPLAATAGNFLRAVPLALAAGLLVMPWVAVHAAPSGIALAVASGALTSGVGYVVWYAALKGLTAMRAATVQLAVPPIAAAGGAWLLAESLSGRLLIASTAILGGIALVLNERARIR